MKIAVGNDHPAYELKCAVKKRLEERGHEAIDVGSHNAESTDYPIYGAAVGELVASGEADLGVVMCGTGIGISIAANKTPGVRAALCWNILTAKASREHNNANVLAIGARLTAQPLALEILDAWLDADFEGGRHARRVGLISGMDARRREGD